MNPLVRRYEDLTSSRESWDEKEERKMNFNSKTGGEIP
jgi:hypothetical protein